MPSSTSKPKLLCGGALVLAFSILFPLEASPDGQRSIFGEVLEVRVINLEVVVTDRQGRRVSGLAPEDFELLVDGAVTPIDYFTEVRDGVAVPRPAAGEESTIVSPPAAGERDRVPTRYLVFIDELFAVGSHRDRALASIRAHLDRLAPGDEMAVVAFDGRRLDVLAQWTGDRAEVGRALDRALDRRTRGLERRAERDRLLSDVDLRQTRRAAFRGELPHGAREAYGHDIATTLSAEQRAYASLLAAQIGQVSSAAATAMRSLAPGSGRKVLMLLAGGWPFEPVEAAAKTDRTWSKAIVSETDIPAGEELFRPIVTAANRLGYTVFPVDLPGLQGMEGLMTRSAPGVSEDWPSGGPAPGTADSSIEAALLHIAERTGGKALLNDRMRSSLALAAQDTRSYYWLGFTPDLEEDDGERRIEVRVRGEGLRARSRESFFDLSRAARISAQVESFLYTEPPEERGFPVRVGPPEPVRAGRMEVPLTLAIPVRAVTLFEQGGDYVGELELRLAALDDRGGNTEIPVIPLHLRAGEEPSSDGFLRYETTLTLRAEGHDLVVAVHDPASGNLLVRRLRVEPG